jgi:N12 class adenine-specific DNA methylase
VTRPKLKGGKRQMNLAEKSTPALEVGTRTELAARMEAIKRRGKPQKGDDIMLSVIGDGRHAAIDMRLVNGDRRSRTRWPMKTFHRSWNC